MFEEENLIENSNEPHVAKPRASIVIRESSSFRSKPHLYRDVTIISPISKAKFPVYLANCQGDPEKVFAMKVFPLDGKEPHKYYKNEIRFASLNHENIIKTLHIESNKTINYKGREKTISYILTELAPFGDFFNFITKYREHLNEKLIRTYFRQLIEGLEYLHNKGAAHLDLKLENLLLGENFSLKIADFDLSYCDKDSRILTTGTKFYRAPELIASRCEDCPAADIYSAGIVMFVMKTGGVIPQSEDILCRGVSLVDLLHNNNTEFWKAHCTFQSKSMAFFNTDFRTLFNGMVRLDPKDRFTIEDVKSSKWYNGPVYTKEELKEYVGSFFKV